MSDKIGAEELRDALMSARDKLTELGWKVKLYPEQKDPVGWWATRGTLGAIHDGISLEVYSKYDVDYRVGDDIWRKRKLRVCAVGQIDFEEIDFVLSGMKILGEFSFKEVEFMWGKGLDRVNDFVARNSKGMRKGQSVSFAEDLGIQSEYNLERGGRAYRVYQSGELSTIERVK